MKFLEQLIHCTCAVQTSQNMIQISRSVMFKDVMCAANLDETVEIGSLSLHIMDGG